jgi:hypothetical protein
MSARLGAAKSGLGRYSPRRPQRRMWRGSGSREIGGGGGRAGADGVWATNGGGHGIREREMSMTNEWHTIMQGGRRHEAREPLTWEDMGHACIICKRPCVGRCAHPVSQNSEKRATVNYLRVLKLRYEANQERRRGLPPPYQAPTDTYVPLPPTALPSPLPSHPLFNFVFALRLIT